QLNKNKLPTHIELDSEEFGLKADSIILTEQIRTIDKSRLKEKIGHINDAKVMSQIDNALGVSFGLE
ncbi:MAG: type II toxin-antitoxin system PemK/MazF family toxin, partial [Clostridia bacterium]